MLRIILGVTGGFISWVIVWFVTEKALSAISPAFKVHQKAFEEAIKMVDSLRQIRPCSSRILLSGRSSQ